MPELQDRELERRFHGRMVGIYERAKSETGYVASRFLQMISESGGLEAARRLLHSDEVSDGFVALWERGRLDLAVENLILEPVFHDLFSDSDREIAVERLKRYGYSSRWSSRPDETSR